MNELMIKHSEKELLTYFQKIRLYKSRELNESNVNRTNKVNEEKATFKETMNNIGRFFERNLKSYDKQKETIDKSIDEFVSKNKEVISTDEAKDTINLMFENDKFGLAKLMFAASVILDNEYDYQYVDEGLEEVSVVLYDSKETLKEIKKQLETNFNAVSPKPLSNFKNETITVAAVASLAAIMIIPSLIVAAPIVAATVVLDNNEKIKEEFKKSTPEKGAFYLALQLTYIERVRYALTEDEFKEELDNILKNVNSLKSDVDYYLFVEKESISDNRAKEKAIHQFDNRLMKILDIEK